MESDCNNTQFQLATINNVKVKASKVFMQYNLSSKNPCKCFLCWILLMNSEFPTINRLFHVQFLDDRVRQLPVWIFFTVCILVVYNGLIVLTLLVLQLNIAVAMLSIDQSRPSTKCWSSTLPTYQSHCSTLPRRYFYYTIRVFWYTYRSRDDRLEILQYFLYLF